MVKFNSNIVSAVCGFILAIALFVSAGVPMWTYTKTDIMSSTITTTTGLWRGCVAATGKDTTCAANDYSLLSCNGKPIGDAVAARNNTTGAFLIISGLICLALAVFNLLKFIGVLSKSVDPRKKAVTIAGFIIVAVLIVIAVAIFGGTWGSFAFCGQSFCSGSTAGASCGYSFGFGAAIFSLVLTAILVLVLVLDALMIFGVEYAEVEA